MKPVLTVILLILSTLQLARADEEIGRALFARGAATAQSPDGKVRLLGPKSPLFAGDTLSTGKQSFAVIRLEDGTRMSLRPNTVFALEQYAPRENSAVMRLFKGGLRALTGLFSKRNPNGLKLHASTATIGIRGTEFDARLCGDDCQGEAARYAPRRHDEARVVGRVALLKGTLNVQGQDRQQRQAVPGTPLYEGDRLTTGAKSFSVLAFRDQGRVTLQANSEFAIDRLDFDSRRPEEGNAVFRFLRGGIRALTGLIGKRNRPAYRMITPVATIGIRGTGFDLVCQGTCTDDAAAPAPGGTDTAHARADKRVRPANAVPPRGNGLYAHVWDGEILMDLEGGAFPLERGKTVFLRHRRATPQHLPTPPLFMRQNPAPRPDRVDVDFKGLFETVPLTEYRPGLFINLIDGHLALDTEDGQHLDLGAGEAASLGRADGKLVRLDTRPAVLSDDPYFKVINKDVLEFIDLLGEDFDGDYECTIQ